MSPSNADQAHRTPFVRRFQESVTLIEYDGRPVVVAREFGELLGYADGGDGLVDLVSGRWSDEFIPDVDVILLKNGRLAAFKRLCAELGLDRLVDKRAPALLLLTESGIQLVLAKTEKPEGKVFRRWLVSEVLPAFHQAPAIAASTPAAIADDREPARQAARQRKLLPGPDPVARLRRLITELEAAGDVDETSADLALALLHQVDGERPFFPRWVEPLPGTSAFVNLRPDDGTGPEHHTPLSLSWWSACYHRTEAEVLRGSRRAAQRADRAWLISQLCHGRAREEEHRRRVLTDEGLAYRRAFDLATWLRWIAQDVTDVAAFAGALEDVCHRFDGELPGWSA